MNQPFLFFAFANVPERYLPNLQTELRGILDYFSSLKYERGLVDFDHREQTSTKDFFSIFNKIGPKITILHYSGHAENFSMELDDDKLTIQKLVNTISNWNNLQLVFLNGCSTAEMVDMLLEAGVKAVIATSEAIDDNKACDFSTLFYEKFSIKNKSLKVAFRQTVNELKNYEYKEETAFIARSAGDRADFEEILEELPWALYYREEDKSILDWELIHTATTLDVDTITLKKIETVKKEIKTEKENIGFLKEDLLDFEDSLADLDENSPKRSRFLRRVKNAKEDLLEAEDILTAHFSKLKSIIKSNDKIVLTESLKSALFKLNYGPQLDFFEKKIISSKINAFIVQGSHQCGQDLLKERLIERAGLRYEGNYHEEIQIDFSANSFEALTINNIWGRIKEELSAIEAVEPQKIIQEIYEKYYSEEKDLVFVFNNIHHFQTDKTFPVIKTFWKDFLNGFLPLLAGTTIKNRVILIVIDKSCHFEKTGNDFVSSKEEIFKDHLESLTELAGRTHIMPIVHPVFAEQLTTWKRHQDLPIDFGLTTDKLKKITGAEGNLMLPTIKELCKITNMEEIYQLYFSQYVHRQTDNL